MTIDEARRRLEDAVERGDDEALHAWSATGRDGLEALRRVLLGEERLGARSDRESLDNMTAAVVTIAASHPGDFLEVFADTSRDQSITWILDGLGHIDDPRATARLVAATRSGNQWARMSAAIGLGRRRSADASDALVQLLRDADYLVRYHALRSLASAGDARALPALRSYRSTSKVELDLATEAARRIESRELEP
jgi:HEAT repeat protein